MLQHECARSCIIKYNLAFSSQATKSVRRRKSRKKMSYSKQAISIQMNTKNAAGALKSNLQRILC